ncbi:hypothetical protein NDU88_002854 [Pleurodeles waltl]|uniref:Uncharacterized protein n=1 Tax=Pleurodeles waltl TaxID=8319 RepID=A0AAV7NIY0_PLEWA|nr:hypothetical protein NDU88_002854 [Pleurodeles waltl]
MAPTVLSDIVGIERARMVPIRKPIPGGPPRPIVAMILNFGDQDVLLQATRERALILVDYVRVSLFPDYTIATQHKLASFQEVKRQLRTEGLTYALLLTVKLKVLYDQQIHFSEAPEQALDGWNNTSLIPGSGN